jgi:hypothetical protein
MNFCAAIRCLPLAISIAAAEAFAQKPPMEPQLTPLPHPALPKPVPPATPTSHGWLLVFGALTAVLFGVVIWMLFRRQARQPAPEVPPLTQAHRRLLALLNEVDQLDPAEVGHRVSVIVRDYQMGRYRVPAPYRTREELYDFHEFATDAERQDRFASMALTCDQIAFAPAPATKADAETLVKAAIEMLRREVFHAVGTLAVPDSPPQSID